MIGKELNAEELDLLLNAPVYVTLLAAVKDGDVEDSERKMGERITGLRSEQGDLILRDYYEKVNHEFSERISRLHTMLPAGTDERTRVLSRHLEQVRKITDKLPEKEKVALQSSLRSLARQIEQADRNLLQYFLIPFGISESDDEHNNRQGPESRHYAP